MQLIVGCGPKWPKRENDIFLDCRKFDNVDVVHDLNETNSFKTGYSYDKLFDSTMFALHHLDQLQERADNIRKYVQTYTWDYWMTKINDILCNL